MILKEWYWDSSIEEIDVSKAQFWVQLHSIDLSIASLHNIALIGRHIGTLLKIKPLLIGGACKKFIRN